MGKELEEGKVGKVVWDLFVKGVLVILKYFGFYFIYSVVFLKVFE